MAVIERRTSTSRHSLAPRASRGKSWVLAMLAPKRGLCVAPVPPLRGGFDPACARLPKGWQVGTEEQVL